MFKEALAKLTGNRKVNLSTARPQLRGQTGKLPGGKALCLDQQLHYQNYSKARKTTKSIP